MSRDLATEFLTDRTGIAYILGCSVNHVNKLVARGLPRRARGQYAIPDCVQWMISDATTRSGVDPDELPAVVEARTRLYVAQEQYKRLETQRLAGEVVDVEAVRETMLELAQVLIGGLEGLPMRAAADAAAARTGSEAAACLREHCIATREELAERIEALADAARADRAPGAPAAATNGGAVGRRRAAAGAARGAAAGAVAD